MLQVEWRRTEECVTPDMVDLFQNLCFISWKLHDGEWPYSILHEALPKITLHQNMKLWQLSKVLFSYLVLSLVSLQRLANSHSPGARNDIKYGQLWAWHSHGNQYVVCHSCNCQAATPFSPNLVLVKEEILLSYSVPPRYGFKNAQMNQVLEIK